MICVNLTRPGKEKKDSLKNTNKANVIINNNNNSNKNNAKSKREEEKVKKKTTTTSIPTRRNKSNFCCCIKIRIHTHSDLVICVLKTKERRKKTNGKTSEITNNNRNQLSHKQVKQAA